MADTLLDQNKDTRNTSPFIGEDTSIIKPPVVNPAPEETSTLTETGNIKPSTYQSNKDFFFGPTQKTEAPELEAPTETKIATAQPATAQPTQYQSNKDFFFGAQKQPEAQNYPTLETTPPQVQQKANTDKTLLTDIVSIPEAMKTMPNYSSMSPEQKQEEFANRMRTAGYQVKDGTEYGVDYNRSGIGTAWSGLFRGTEEAIEPLVKLTGADTDKAMVSNLKRDPVNPDHPIWQKVSEAVPGTAEMLSGPLGLGVATSETVAGGAQKAHAQGLGWGASTGVGLAEGALVLALGKVAQEGGGVLTSKILGGTALAGTKEGITVLAKEAGYSGKAISYLLGKGVPAPILAGLVRGGVTTGEMEAFNVLNTTGQHLINWQANLPHKDWFSEMKEMESDPATHILNGLLGLSGGVKGVRYGVEPQSNATLSNTQIEKMVNQGVQIFGSKFDFYQYCQSLENKIDEIGIAQDPAKKLEEIKTYLASAALRADNYGPRAAYMLRDLTLAMRVENGEVIDNPNGIKIDDYIRAMREKDIPLDANGIPIIDNSVPKEQATSSFGREISNKQLYYQEQIERFDDIQASLNHQVPPLDLVHLTREDRYNQANADKFIKEARKYAEKEGYFDPINDFESAGRFVQEMQAKYRIQIESIRAGIIPVSITEPGTIKVDNISRFGMANCISWYKSLENKFYRLFDAKRLSDEEDIVVLDNGGTKRTTIYVADYITQLFGEERRLQQLERTNAKRISDILDKLSPEEQKAVWGWSLQGNKPPTGSEDPVLQGIEGKIGADRTESVTQTINKINRESFNNLDQQHSESLLKNFLPYIFPADSGAKNIIEDALSLVPENEKMPPDAFLALINDLPWDKVRNANNPVDRTLLIEDQIRKTNILDLASELQTRGLASEVQFNPSWRKARDVYGDLGKYYFPADVAQVLENSYSAGIKGSELEGIIRPANKIGNLFNAIQLFGPYHLLKTELEYINSRLTLTAKSIIDGRAKDALDNFVGLFTDQWSAVAMNLPRFKYKYGKYNKAGNILNQFENLERSQIVQDMQKQFGDPTIHKDARIVQLMVDAGHNFRFDADAYASGLGEKRKDWINKIPGVGGLLNKAINFVDLTGFIQKKWVPALKNMAVYDAIRYELGKKINDPNLNLKDPELLRRARVVVDGIDDRLGQLSYQNLFMNKTLNDSLHTLMGRPGWSIGTLRSYFGAFAETASRAKNILTGEQIQGPVVTHRMAYAFESMLVGTVIVNALYQYLFTKDLPKETTDLFYPKNGQKNPDGTDQRVQLFGYPSTDLVKIFTAPVDYGMGKESPLINTVTSLVFNKDWKGAPIYEGSIPNRIGAGVWWAAKNDFTPMAIDNWRKSEVRQDPLSQQIQSIIGIRPANAAFQHTDNQKYISTQGQQKAELASNALIEAKLRPYADRWLAAKEVIKGNTFTVASDTSKLLALSEVYSTLHEKTNVSSFAERSEERLLKAFAIKVSQIDKEVTSGFVSPKDAEAAKQKMADTVIPFTLNRQTIERPEDKVLHRAQSFIDACNAYTAQNKDNPEARIIAEYSRKLNSYIIAKINTYEKAADRVVEIAQNSGKPLDVRQELTTRDNWDNTAAGTLTPALVRYLNNVPQAIKEKVGYK